MIEKLKANNIFTEYDDSIYLEINKDPLGLQMIWTYFGQQIFDNKTTSVAMDIRSYNINLFNHYLIYQLRKQNIFDKLFTNKKLDTKEKVERMLILLENMLIWSWHKNPDGWVQKGLLGTSKAKEKWGEINLNLDDDIAKLELLKNQKSLGVNGRYKTPFVKMGFFDSNYNYIKNGIVTSEIDSDIFKSDEIKEIFKKNEFKELYDSMMDFFDNTPLQKENIPIENIKNLFANTKTSADITKAFWLDKIGLKTDEAKLVYETIEISNSTKDIYYKAYEKSGDSIKLSSIIQLEPYLVYITNLFDYLFKYDKEDINKIPMDKYFKKYQAYQKLSIDNITSPSVNERLSKINQIKDIPSLVEYHKEIMKQRNQTQWIDIKDDNIKVYNPIKVPNDVEEKLEKEIKDLEWIHDYYIYSIRNIKRGLGDLKDENENTN